MIQKREGRKAATQALAVIAESIRASRGRRSKDDVEQEALSLLGTKRTPKSREMHSQTSLTSKVTSKHLPQLKKQSMSAVSEDQSNPNLLAISTSNKENVKPLYNDFNDKCFIEGKGSVKRLVLRTQHSMKIQDTKRSDEELYGFEESHIDPIDGKSSVTLRKIKPTKPTSLEVIAPFRRQASAQIPFNEEATLKSYFGHLAVSQPVSNLEESRHNFNNENFIIPSTTKTNGTKSLHPQIQYDTKLALPTQSMLQSVKDPENIDKAIAGLQEQQKVMLMTESGIIQENAPTVEMPVTQNLEISGSAKQQSVNDVVQSEGEQHFKNQSHQSYMEDSQTLQQHLHNKNDRSLSDSLDDFNADSMENPENMTQSAGGHGGAGSQGRWTDEEHEKFLDGLRLFGKDWRRIEEYIATRSCSQIRSHAQKYFNRLQRDIAKGIKRSDQDQAKYVLGKKKRKQLGADSLQSQVLTEEEKALSSGTLGTSGYKRQKQDEEVAVQLSYLTPKSKTGAADQMNQQRDLLQTSLGRDAPIEEKTNQQIQQIQDTLLKLNEDDIEQQMKQLISQREQISKEVLFCRIPRDRAGEMLVNITNRFHILAMQALQACKIDICNRLIDERNLTQFVCILLARQITIGPSPTSATTIPQTVESLHLEGLQAFPAPPQLEIVQNVQVSTEQPYLQDNQRTFFLKGMAPHSSQHQTLAQQ